jgi:pyrroloquinoline quinone biosynthesis protein B
MLVRILGSAAGGGFPQWNCACANCAAVRNGRFSGKPRLQTQVAIREKYGLWFLLGASPDLRQQIEHTDELQPSGCIRNSPLAGVLLANANIDQVLGLLLLRELQPLYVWAAQPVIEILRGENSMFAMLNRIGNQVRWNAIAPDEEFCLQSVDGEDSGISCRPIVLSSRYPLYSRRVPDDDAGVLGLVLKSATGKSLGFFPELPVLTRHLEQLFATLDCLLLDGTFWSNDELIRLQGTAQTALEMGHIPVGGEEGTLRRLCAVTKPRRLYIHINNTNPMLNEAGTEYRIVRESGWELACDAWEMSL